MRFGFDTLQLFALSATAAQQGGAQLQARQRGAQFMGNIREQTLLGGHHPLKRRHHLVEAGPCRQELLWPGFQLRVLSQVALRHFIRGVF